MAKVLKHKYEIIIGLVLAALVWRSFYGINYMDESFYMSLAHRLYIGEKLVADEWHPTQFYSFILLPFYAMYRLIVGDARGVVLFFRILNLIFTAFTSLCVFKRVKKENGVSGFGAMAAAMPLLLYAKSNNLGPGYYNLCICFGILGILKITEESQIPIAAQVKDEKEDKTAPGGAGAKVRTEVSKASMFAGGVLMALCVTCMPFMAIPVILYCLFGISQGRRILYFIGGLVATAVVYIPVCFPLGRIPEVMANFPCIFLDPEHEAGFLKYLENTWRSYKLFFVSEYILYALLGLTLIMAFLGMIRKLPGKRARLVIFFVCLAAAAVHSVYKLHRFNGLASIAFTMWMMPVVVINIFEKKFSKLCIYLTLGGAALALCFAGGSDTGFSSLTTGYTICVIAAVISADVFLSGCFDLCRSVTSQESVADMDRAAGSGVKSDEQPDRLKASEGVNTWAGKAAKAGFMLLMTVILAVMLMQRIFIVFRDSDLGNLTERIDQGPMAGLYTTSEHKEGYDKVYDFLIQLQVTESGKKVFFSRMLPWGYLCVPYGFGAPTAWRTQIDSPLLESYYLLHPDSIPDLVVVMNPGVGAFDRNEFSRIEASETPNKNKLEGWFYEYMIQEGYESTEYDVATVWKRPQ